MTVTLTIDSCRVVSGRWLDIYTGQTFTDPSVLDVDHMVPLANAHRSGGFAWDRDMKTTYANALGLGDALIAVSASANRSKGDQSPDEWMPPNSPVHCRYAIAWVDVKYQWSLTVTAAERGTLQAVLARC